MDRVAFSHLFSTKKNPTQQYTYRTFLHVPMSSNFRPPQSIFVQCISIDMHWNWNIVCGRHISQFPVAILRDLLLVVATCEDKQEASMQWRHIDVDNDVNGEQLLRCGLKTQFNQCDAVDAGRKGSILRIFEHMKVGFVLHKCQLNWEVYFYVYSLEHTIVEILNGQDVRLIWIQFELSTRPSRSIVSNEIILMNCLVCCHRFAHVMRLNPSVWCMMCLIWMETEVVTHFRKVSTLYATFYSHPFFSLQWDANSAVCEFPADAQLYIHMRYGCLLDNMYCSHRTPYRQHSPS